MAKYVIDESTLAGLANAIRTVTGDSKTYTPNEMIQAVTNIMESATYILVDGSGREIPAVYVDNEVVFTATPNDIRIGTTAVTDAGITEGEKEIPAYHTHEGYRVVTNGSRFVIPHEYYDYTKLQVIICAYNTSLTNSVGAKKIVVYDKVYDVNSTESLSNVVKDNETECVDLGIVNDTGGICVLRYFMYKEIY